jgi:hypothetical protein
MVGAAEVEPACDEYDASHGIAAGHWFRKRLFPHKTPQYPLHATAYSHQTRHELHIITTLFMNSEGSSDSYTDILRPLILHRVYLPTPGLLLK